MRSAAEVLRAGTLFGTLVLACVACSGPDSRSDGAAGHGGADNPLETRGAQGGRLLTSNDFELELAMLERGIPPEFRAWATEEGRPVAPEEVSLHVKLARLSGRVDQISFVPHGDYLRGDAVVEEPHSFEVSVEAEYGGETHVWHYEDFEGRTRIDPEVAKNLGVETAIVGPAVLEETVTAYGRIRANPERVREVRARFDGLVRAVHAELGSMVAKGDPLLAVESNESLRTYSVHAPIGGVVTQRDANPGEQTGGRLLLTITDPSSAWVDLAVFPANRDRVRVGNPVSIAPAAGGEAVTGAISTIEVIAQADQSVTARVVLPNPEGRLVPGTFVTAEIVVGEHEVPLAVRRVALQTHGTSTVVYAQVGDQYEMRKLELGRQGAAHIEALAGIEAGTRYVVVNSYVIKADIEKSGASHGH